MKNKKKAPNTISNTVTVLYLKDDQINWIPASDQTKKNRDQINNKIKELGNKYFQVKALFDQMNLRRDHLYFKGQELVDLYKDRKPGLSIHTPSRRMKESLYCWYAENFYCEIFNGNVSFLNFLKSEAINIKKYKKRQRRKRSETIITSEDLEELDNDEQDDYSFQLIQDE